MQVLRTAFKQPLSPEVTEFVSSVKDDQALIEADIKGSLAHARMLAQVGLLSQDQHAALEGALSFLLEESSKIELLEEYEDVHMNIEKKLEMMIGTDAHRLHTARSRNDQVALDTRLFVLDAIATLEAKLKQLQMAIVEKAEQHPDAILPGYTHMQRAQPVLFAHSLLAFYEMIARDSERFKSVAQRTAVSPLGAGAQAGTSLPIDPALSASYLGIQATFGNSIDAVSDRDFAADFLFAAAMTATHLSQMAETLMLWSTKEFDFIQFPDSLTTASSLMPQKKNPDPIEIVRGKTGAIFGELVNLLVTLKGLPLGYNRDLQETKPPAIRAYKVLYACLGVMKAAFEGLTINAGSMIEAASSPELMTTDLVEYLVLKGVPFRTAHEKVSALVQASREEGKSLDELTLSAYQQFSEAFQSDLYKLFDPAVSIARKVSPGGTGVAQVKNALEEAKQELG